MQWKVMITVAGLAMVGTPAVAQLSGPPDPPAAGTVDGAAAARGKREQLEGYNRVVNQGVKVSNVDEKGGRKKKNAARLAETADFATGAAVRDKFGVQVATIEQFDETGVVVKADMRLAKLPQQAFGKDDSGLLLGISADEFRAAIAESSVPVVQEPLIVDATVADMVKGAPVRDSEGVEFGKIEGLVENGVVLAMGDRKVRLKLQSFAKDEKGLIIGITASELRALLPS